MCIAPSNKPTGQMSQKDIDSAYRLQNLRGGSLANTIARRPGQRAGELIPWTMTSQGRKANTGSGQGALAGGGANPTLLGDAGAANPANSGVAAQRRRRIDGADSSSAGGTLAGQNTLLGG